MLTPVILLLTLAFISCKMREEIPAATRIPGEVVRDSLRATEPAAEKQIELARSAGYTHYYEGDIASATALFSFAYQQDNTDTENRYAMSLVHAVNGNYDQSLVLLDQIIRLDSLAKLSPYGSKASIYIFKGETHKARSLVSKMLKSKYDKIRREAYSVGSMLSIWEEDTAGAVRQLKFRIPISKKLHNDSTPRLEHPYWDYHLIGNIFLTAQQPDSAEIYFKQGLNLLDPKDKPKTLNVIRDDYNYFRSMYLLKKGNYDESYSNLKEDLEAGINVNGYGAIWARILIEKNLPDSAINVLNTYCRNGYYTKFVKAKAHLRAERKVEGEKLLREVLAYHQIGEWYWQHEYALISAEARQLYSSSGLPTYGGN